MATTRRYAARQHSRAWLRRCAYVHGRWAYEPRHLEDNPCTERLATGRRGRRQTIRSQYRNHSLTSNARLWKDLVLERACCRNWSTLLTDASAEPPYTVRLARAKEINMTRQLWLVLPSEGNAMRFARAPCKSAWRNVAAVQIRLAKTWDFVPAKSVEADAVCAPHGTAPWDRLLRSWHTIAVLSLSSASEETLLLWRQGICR